MLGWSDDRKIDAVYGTAFDEGAEAGYYKGYQDALEGKPNKYEEEKREREERKSEGEAIVKVKINGVWLNLTEVKDAESDDTGEAAESE